MEEMLRSRCKFRSTRFARGAGLDDMHLFQKVIYARCSLNAHLAELVQAEGEISETLHENEQA